MSAIIPISILTTGSVARGKSNATTLCCMAIGVIPLPSDPIGVVTVTFSGVNANSEIRVSLSDLTEMAGVENCTANHALTWDVYASGSANNTVRIVIIHPDYKIKEFTYVSSVGNQSIPVQQEPDKWYRNPA